MASVELVDRINWLYWLLTQGSFWVCSSRSRNLGTETAGSESESVGDGFGVVVAVGVGVVDVVDIGVGASDPDLMNLGVYHLENPDVANLLAKFVAALTPELLDGGVIDVALVY
jgi:hypothetical protein